MVKNWFVLLISLALMFGALACLAGWLDSTDDDMDGDGYDDY